MPFYNPAAPVRNIDVEGRYAFDKFGAIDEGEILRCSACGWTSSKIGTRSYLWKRIVQEAQPPTLELCEFCHRAAGGPEI